MSTAPELTEADPGASADPPLLELSRLRAGYRVRGPSGLGRRTVEAVAGVDLTVQAGQTVCVVGESGCGKSTLARTVVGLVPVLAGSVTVDGTDVATAGRRRRRALARDVGMVFQDPYTSLNPRMRVGEAVAEGWQVHRGVVTPSEQDAETARLLERVGLDAAVAGRRLHELSGGQCQRVSIARALALRPRLVVLDEAVSALDVSVRAQVLNLLADLQAELGIAYLFISHDLDVVAHIADEVAVMYLGRVVERGPANRVFSDPRHPYTRALLAAAPRIDDRAGDSRPEPLGGDVPSAADPPSGCRFRTRCPIAQDVCAGSEPVLQIQTRHGHGADSRAQAHRDAGEQEDVDINGADRRGGDRDAGEHQVACFFAHRVGYERRAPTE